jgi:hypothetical protein
MLWTRINRRNKWTHKQVYKQSIFFISTASSARELHSYTVAEEAKPPAAGTKPIKRPRPPKARTFPPLPAGKPPNWGLPRLDRRVHRLPLPDRSGSGLGTPRNRPREGLRDREPAETRRVLVRSHARRRCRCWCRRGAVEPQANGYGGRIAAGHRRNRRLRGSDLGARVSSSRGIASRPRVVEREWRGEGTRMGKGIGWGHGAKGKLT